MRHLLLSVGLFAATLTTAQAEFTGKPYRFFVDSDGYVISILYGAGGPDTIPEIYWRGGLVYATTVDLSGNGDITTAIEFAAIDDAGTPPPEVTVDGGPTLTVEQSGSDVFLVDPATGTRYATSSRRVSANAQINPQRFGLD